MADIHPEKNLLLQGANLITLFKDNQFFSMTFAWGMAVGEDSMLCLLGSQSDTSKAIKIGDKVGISGLSKKQKDIALWYGSSHSLKENKFKEEYFEKIDDVYVVKNATRQLVGEVIDIFHLIDNDEDNIVYIKINKKINGIDDFVTYKELKED